MVHLGKPERPCADLTKSMSIELRGITLETINLRAESHLDQQKPKFRINCPDGRHSWSETRALHRAIGGQAPRKKQRPLDK